MAILSAKEIYQLELFISPIYLAELRDTWGAMIKHVERCLDEYTPSRPSNYRKKPLPEQPDAVWGRKILPNFQDTYQSLCSGVIALTHGDLSALSMANGPLDDYKGQREFSSEWLSNNDADIYFELLNKSHTLALNICATDEPYWRPGDLLEHSAARGDVTFPEALPAYQLNYKHKTTTGDTVPHAGIYVPDLDNSCPQYLSIHKMAPAAVVRTGMRPLLHPSTGLKYGEEAVYEKLPCIWTLVERVSASSASAPTTLVNQANRRVASGDICPESGYYFAPSSADSRSFFGRGVVMPTFASEYDATIWQWDAQQ